MKAPRKLNTGFTLLEVMIALSIMGISLVAIMSSQGTSMNLTNKAKFLTLATLLANSKMIDIEQELKEKGFGDFEKELNGDFSDDGYPLVKWYAEIKKVEISVPTDLGKKKDSSGGGNNDNLALPSMYSSIISEFISNALREVKLTVYIGEKEAPDNSLDITTHFIETQRAGYQQMTVGGGK